MKEEHCVVVENRNLSKKYYLMKLHAEYISAHTQPGHFLMLAVSTSSDPLLKRPFGILKSEPPYTWIYYEAIGRGTEMLAEMQPGARVHAIGPLGNAFPELHQKNILLVAGGRGIAPLYNAALQYTRQEMNNRVFLLYGARSREDLNLLPELEMLPFQEKFLYTDDGSFGKKGLITTDINEIIKKNALEVTISCGPDAMFKVLSRTLRHTGTENYASLEAKMGCGFGICYSCVVKTIDAGYKKVCTDGPIFRLEEISWEEHP